MTPFTVECTTCRRRLLVRSDALIGQILPCPKCGSMVLIEPPAGHAPAAVRSERPPQTTPSASTTSFESHVGALEGDMDRLLTAEDPQQADTVEDPLLAGTSPVARKVADPAATAGALPATPPPSAWMSEESRLMKRWLAIGSIASAAVILLIIVLGLAWSSRRPAAATSGAGKSAPAPKTPAPKTPASKTPATAEPVEPTEPKTDGAAPPAEPDDAAPMGDDELSAETENAAPAEAAANGTPATRPADTASGEPARPGQPTEAAAAVAGGAAPPTAADRTALPPIAGLGPTMRSPEALRDFDGLLADSSFDPTPVADDSPYDLIPAPGTPYDLAAAMPRPAAHVVSAATQLAIRIPELDFREAQLGGFLRFIADFTTMPITVDADALYRAGLTPRSPIEYQATNEELQKILADALAPLGLRFVSQNGHLVVRQQDDDVLVEQDYEVFDLIGDAPDEAKALEDVMMSLVMPGSWERAGGQGSLRLDAGKLHVKAYPAAQWELLMFCQRLRLARGLRPQGEMPAHAPGLDLRIEAALTTLAQPVSVAHPVPVPLLQILDELAAAADADFWIDWLALEEIGWNRAALARLEVTEQPLSQALQTLLGPMELSFRVIDAKTFEITSAAAAFRKLELGFFPVRERLEREGAQELVERVRTALGDTLVTGKGGGGLRFDATSQTLVLAAPQHQLAAVARMLAQSSASVAPEPGAAEAPEDPEAPGKRDDFGE